MALVNRRKISLYDEAKAGFSSLVQQTAQVGVGLLTLLLLTGGNPPAFTVPLSVFGGVAFVAWSEQKRLTKRKTSRSFINPILGKVEHQIKQDMEADTEKISDLMTGIFIVGETGEVSIDFLFDGGKYKGELAIFSLDGMDELQFGSEAFIKEAASRAISNSQLGYTVISDSKQAARFSAKLGTAEQNQGTYLGVKNFAMRPGDKFAIMLVQNGKVLQVLDNPAISGQLLPLLSLGTANSNDMFHMAQIADVTGDGNVFAMEDMRVDTGRNKDYNDFIFQIQGATGRAILLDEVINPSLDWRKTEIGKVLIACATPKLSEFPKENKPLMGVIDTDFDVNNHDNHILGLIADGMDINDIDIHHKEPIWLGHVTASSQWAESLIQFVEAAKKSGQPNAVVNLSLSLSQANPDDSVTTRYELTPQERAALEYARQNNVLIVVSANNNRDVMSLLAQASQEFDNIVTVGLANRLNRESYSNYGYELDILASGGGTENLKVTACVDAIAKTSVATAKVTGVVSLVWAANPQLTYRQVIDILQSTATDLKVLGWDIKQVLLR